MNFRHRQKWWDLFQWHFHEWRSDHSCRRLFLDRFSSYHNLRRLQVRYIENRLEQRIDSLRAHPQLIAVAQRRRRPRRHQLQRLAQRQLLALLHLRPLRNRVQRPG
uniref:(northern house mosquito) hypothetical protein n=1 Tax=Culex pipiens TaxID=7175 RepID=A0A8D8E1V9_CULPI